jgi:hypothetical protein
MFDAASRMALGDYDEAIDVATRAMSQAIRNGDRAGEERIAVLVAQWSWEAYAATKAREHLDRAERILRAVPEATLDPRVTEMAAGIRVKVSAEVATLERATPQVPPPALGAGLDGDDTRAPASQPGAQRADLRGGADRRRAARLSMVVVGAVGVAGGIGLLAAGGAFLRGLPGAQEVQAGGSCGNCQTLGVGYMIGGAVLTAGAAALLGVGIRRMIQARGDRAERNHRAAIPSYGRIVR